MRGLGGHLHLGRSAEHHGGPALHLVGQDASVPGDDYLNGGEASRTETINGFYGRLLGQPHLVHAAAVQVPRRRMPNLVDTVANWAQTIWTQADWNRVKNASCSPQGNYVRCSTESF